MSDSDSPPPEFEGTRLLTAVVVVDVHVHIVDMAGLPDTIMFPNLGSN